MILSGWKRSATWRANWRITRMGTSAPRYQRAGGALAGIRLLSFMRSFYRRRFRCHNFPLEPPPTRFRKQQHQ
jgi:hypothetical protein